MANIKILKKKSLLKIIKSAFSNFDKCENIELKDSYRLPNKKIVFPLENYPLQLNVGDKAHVLHLYPERPLITQSNQDSVFSETNYILFDPDSYFSSTSGFYRLQDGDKLTLGGNDKLQCDVLNIPKRFSEQQLSILNDEGKLIFKCHHPETGSCISPLLKEKRLNKINSWRYKKIKQLTEIIGDPLKPLSSEYALVLIRQVNQVLENEVYRQKNLHNKPGGVLAIPDKMNTLIIGDMHTLLDNLLTLLSHNNFLDALDKGQACLIILGDAVHPEIENQYDEMESSILMMDVIFKLKLRFPKHFFYIRGNHDSFSDEISKQGVLQGLLWSKQLKKSRGKIYKKEMQRFYDNLPYLAYSQNFICCHAGPPTSAINLHALVNITHYPKLMKDVINGRIQTSNRMSGYNKSDIQKLCKCLNVSKDTPFIVGHTPMDNTQTLWENVAGISNHSIIYSAHPQWAGIMAQIGNCMYPLVYPVEPLTKLVSSMSQ